MVVSLAILLILLFSSPSQGGLLVFLLVLAWMLLVAVGLLICLCIKKQVAIAFVHRCELHPYYIDYLFLDQHRSASLRPIREQNTNPT